MEAKKAYLVAYNGACMLGWAYCGVMGCVAAATNLSMSAFVPGVWTALSVVQLSACLEIAHSACGIVRSPIMTTFMQVFSRVWVILIMILAPEVRPTWYAGMMALSWSLVEVPRYAFYVANLVGAGGVKSIPYPLFWLRYSLFAVLYPTGITGELLTMYDALFQNSLRNSMVGFLLPVLMKAVFAMYVPASPFMYMHMVSQRGKQMKARFAPAPPPPKGVVFPEDGEGGRTTTITGRKIFQAALLATGDKEAAEKVMKGNFRFGYQRHIMKLVRRSCETPQAAIDSANAGINYIYDNFEFADPATSKIQKFMEEVNTNKKTFATAVVKGEPSSASQPYKIPFDGSWHPATPNPPAVELTGMQIKQQVSKWVDKSIIEKDAGKAIDWTVDYFADGGKADDIYVVMIGAGSAMGPFPKLMEMGANVVAIDIPGSWGKGGKRPTSGLWKRLVETAKKSPGGSIIFPLDPSKSQKELEASTDPSALFEAAGCNLIEQPAEVANWLVEWQATLPATAKVCIGNYTYLDGENHVKLALCADHCIKRLREARPSTSVAFLCTPTDIHVIPEDAHQAAVKNFGTGMGYQVLEKLVNVLSRGACLVSNVVSPVPTASGHKIHLVDGITVPQGPNYALAKRMQHWRAQIAFHEGATVSSSVAPSTATISVIHNKTFAWAYGGLPYFGYEVFKQDTTNAVMAALLMHDLLNEKGPKNAKNKKEFGIENTLQLFSTQGVHGGLWRCAYTINSLGETAALIYFLGERTVQLGLGAAVALAAASYFAF